MSTGSGAGDTAVRSAECWPAGDIGIAPAAPAGGETGRPAASRLAAGQGSLSHAAAACGPAGGGL